MSDVTPKAVAYLGTEEGIVCEAYKDSKGIWTWAMGIATTGGNDVMRYKDNPQPLAVALRASVSLIRARYLPPVLRAFAGHNLAENEIAAALSFEWRNGTIESATWVSDYCAGNIDAAERDFMNWTDHGRETDRATRERDLFFSAKWPASLSVPVYQVAKPSYVPVHATFTDVVPVLQSIMGGS